MPKAPLYGAYIPPESERESSINSLAPVLFVVIAISLTVVVIGLPLYLIYLIFSFVDVDVNAYLPDVVSKNNILRKALVGALLAGSLAVGVSIYRKCQELFENWRKGKRSTSGG